MNPKLLLRITAGCTAFFAVGHSIGHFTGRELTDPAGQEVLHHMKTYKFPLGSHMRSFDEFYSGMSINLIITLLCFTIIIWMLSDFSETNPDMTRKLLRPLLFAIAAFCATSFMYFFFVPAITCLAASLLIAWTIIILSKPEV